MALGRDAWSFKKVKDNPTRSSRLLPLLGALALIVSLSLLAFAYLKGSVVDSIHQARQAEEEERLEDAMARHRDLTSFLRNSRLLQSLFWREYSQSLAGQMRILYSQRNFDEVIALADSVVQEEIDDLATVYFWSGNAFFAKGADRDAAEDSYSGFNRAEAHYRKALELDEEGRWEIRYNFELVRTVLDQAEKSQGKKPVKIMRPSEATTGRPSKKVEG